jgi:hypothetical protein
VKGVRIIRCFCVTLFLTFVPLCRAAAGNATAVTPDGGLDARQVRKMDASRVTPPAVCEKKEMEKDGTKNSYRVNLEKSGEGVFSVVYSGSSISGHEGGAYFCDLKVSTFDKNVRFSKSGNTTIIEIGGYRQSTVEVNEISGGFSVGFDSIDQSIYCGAGAQIPAKMTLTSDKKCSVKF